MFAGDNAAPSLAASQAIRRLAADFVDGFWIVADVASMARFFKPRINRTGSISTPAAQRERRALR
jgi:hypothetical protein